MTTKIFSFKMLSEDGAFYNKVASIKGLRGLSVLGLKEAKILSETIAAAYPNAYTTSLEVTADDDKIKDAIFGIENGGIGIIDNSGPLRAVLLASVQTLCVDAITKGEYDIAQVLLDLLVANK